MDEAKSRFDSKATAVTAAIVAILNVLAGMVGLPVWATPDLALLVNGAVMSVASVVFYVRGRTVEPAK